MARPVPIAYDPDLGQWIVCTYDDVRALLVDDRLTPDRLHGFAERAPAEAVAAVRRHAPWLLASAQPGYAWIGPVVHAGLRAAGTAAFRASIATASEELLGELARRERFELVGDYASALSGRMLAGFLGVDAAEGERLLGWGRDVVACFGKPEITVAGAERMARSAAAVVTCVDRLLDAGGGQPRFLELVREEAARRRRTLDEGTLASIALPLVTGHVDLASLVAVTIWLLLAHPDQRARLEQDPGLLGAAVDEALRVGAPVARVPRTALAPVAVRGRVIQPGQRVQLSLAAANRDPTRFPDPDRFDIARPPTRSLGFGHGARSCIAARLSRTHAATAVDAFLRHVPRLVSDPERGVTLREVGGEQALEAVGVRVGSG